MRFVPMSDDEVTELNQRFASAAPDELLSWALEQYGQTIALSCGFGLEGTCVLDMLAKIDRNAKVFTLDTGRLPQETYDLIQRCQDRYGLKIDIYFPGHAEVEQMIGQYGTNLFYKSREYRRLTASRWARATTPRSPITAWRRA
jgi:phosphoadenosine phosphosulfate reductase